MTSAAALLQSGCCCGGCLMDFRATVSPAYCQVNVGVPADVQGRTSYRTGYSPDFIYRPSPQVTVFPESPQCQKCFNVSWPETILCDGDSLVFLSASLLWSCGGYYYSVTHHRPNFGICWPPASIDCCPSIRSAAVYGLADADCPFDYNMDLVGDW